MRIGDKYRTEHTDPEVLTVSKLYGTRMGAVRVGETDRYIVFSHNKYDIPMLSLAHISKDKCEMHKVHEKLTEPTGEKISW